jgi:glutamate-1-semialdehyde 2,1-aminomutase
MGNGYPIAAIGGKKDIMMSIEPGKVAHGGTYTGNVVGTAAADATLEFMKTGKIFENLNRVGKTLMEGISEILTRHGVAHHIHGTPAMFGITIGEVKPKDFRDLYELPDWEMYETISNHLIENGVMPEPDGLEPWFLCSDHTDEDAAETLQKYEEAVKFTLNK